jgi:hypothetical protein
MKVPYCLVDSSPYGADSTRNVMALPCNEAMEFGDGREIWLTQTLPQYGKALEGWFHIQMTINPDSDEVILRDNDRGIDNNDTIITRNHEFLLKNEPKNVCFKIDTTKTITMKCGTGGLVKFESSEFPDPTNQSLKKNPGSVQDPAKNSDPCGPLLAEPEDFHFAKNAPIQDLYLTYQIRDQYPYFSSITIYWTHAVTSFSISCYNNIKENWYISNVYTNIKQKKKTTI